MNAYDAYKQYIAFKLHFTSRSYDYHRYSGGSGATAASFEKRAKEHRHFLKISRNRDPESFIIGNMMFNSDTYVGAFTSDHQKEFEKFRDTGAYHFKGDLGKLKPVFNDNFIVDPDNSTPYILRLLMNRKISLFTACVFEQLLNCDTKWARSDNYLIFSTLAHKIVKSAPFFKIDSAKYRAIVIEHFDALALTS